MPSTVSNFTRWLERNQLWLVLLVSLIIIVNHFRIIGAYSTNAPYWDDLDVILRTADNMSSGAGTFDQIFLRHNEHRVAVNKSIDALQLLFSGKVSIQQQVFIGNIFLLGLLVTLVIFFKKYLDKPWYLFLPAAAMLFTLAGYEAFLWAMVSIQTMAVILFSMIAFLVLFKSQDPPKWGTLFLAFVFGCIATYSCGNGFLCLLLCFIGILTQRWHYKFPIVWGLMTVVVFFLYFKGYQPIPGHPKPMDAIILGPDQLLSHFFIMLGGGFKIRGQFNFPAVIGLGFLILSAVLFYFIPKEYFRKNPIGFYFLMFIILSCALTSLSRSGFGSQQAFSVRYQPYSQLVLLFMYFGLIDLTFDRSTFSKFAFPVFIVWSYVGYYSAIGSNMKAVKRWAFQMENSAFAYHNNLPPAFVYPDQAGAMDVVAKSDSLGIYSYPRPDFDRLNSKPVTDELPPETGTIKYAFDIRPDADRLIIYDGWAFIDGLDYGDYETVLVLASNGKNYLFQTNYTLRNDVSAAFGRDLTKCGFTVFADKASFPDGSYRVGFFIRKGRIIREGEYALEFVPKMLIKKDGKIELIDEPINHAKRQEELASQAAPSSNVDELSIAGTDLKIRGWAILSGVSSKNVALSIVARHEDKSVDIPLTTEVRKDVSNAFAGDYDLSGFQGNLNMSHQPKGKYQLFLNFVVGEKTISKSLDKEFVIK